MILCIWMRKYLSIEAAVFLFGIDQQYLMIAVLSNSEFNGGCNEYPLLNFININPFKIFSFYLQDYLSGWLVGFYAISTLVANSMLNPVYTYILYTYMICKWIVCRS